ncbi:hypothetical protein [Butyrivibrio proteoclasticus]|uniref:hypothetical protein n=1 Tax=Butyrivibrio proteoclasticus TaxID=43305 RepID=UPI00047BF22A|nr:hypothetical protein [Butyrivibrio proteoclasticus]
MKKNLLTLGALTLTTAITASSLTGCGFSYTLGDSSASEDSRTPHDEDTSNDQSKDNSHASNNDDKKDKNGNGGDDKNGSSDKNSAGHQSTDPSDYDYSQDYFGFSFYFNTTDESGYELQEVDYDAKNVTELPGNISADNFLCYKAFDGNDSIGSEYIITNDDVLDLRYVNNCGGDDYCFRGFVDGEDEFYSALGKLEYFDPTEDEEWELDGGILNYGILYFEEDGETYWVYTNNIFGFDYYLDYDAEYTVIDDQKELDAIADMVNSEEYNGFVSQEFININEIVYMQGL